MSDFELFWWLFCMPLLVTLAIGVVGEVIDYLRDKHQLKKALHKNPNAVIFWVD